MRTTFGPRHLFLLLVAGSTATAQTPSATLPPIRTISRVLASSPALKNPTEVRQLSDGRVLVNDASARLLLLFDSLLTTPIVVLDSSGPPERRYGAANGRIVAHRGDSTLFFDRGSTAFLLIDPSGKVVRTFAGAAGGRGVIGGQRLDGRGRVIYTFSGGRGLSPANFSDGLGRSISYSYLMGYDLESRLLDTSVVVRVDTTIRASPGTPQSVQASLFPAADTWAQMSDGSIAVVRARDYHVEWHEGGTAPKSSPKVAHEWVRLSDADKQRLADSLTRVRDSSNKVMLASIASRPGTNVLYDATGRIIAWTSSATTGALSGDGPPPPPRPQTPPPPQSLVPIPPDALPDYLPPFSYRAFGDGDNHLWVGLPETMGDRTWPAYDVIDRAGVLKDRVRVPLNATIIGFAPGVVYVMMRDAGAGKVVKLSVR